MPGSRFASLGGAAQFKEMLPVGQLYFPSWERYEKAMRDIFDRRYYTNQGPLAQKLEDELRCYIGVRHVICVTNATVGLMMAAEALELSGKVILPSFTFLASAQSLSWCGIEPVFCDVDPTTHQICARHAEASISEQVSGIMGVNLWGGACDVSALQVLAENNRIKLYFDSAHAFGCSIGETRIGNFGDLEVFSFHATKILSSAEGGCICTNNDEIASKLRNIRSSYGAGAPVGVVKTLNGRMSEAQAALALMSLEDFEFNRQHNEDVFNTYQQGLQDLPGISLIEPSGVTRSNYQYLVCEVDEATLGLSRDELITVLKEENVNARRYFYPGCHRTVEYKELASAQNRRLVETERLCTCCIQLPIGAFVSLSTAQQICDLLHKMHKHAPRLRQVLHERRFV